MWQFALTALVHRNSSNLSVVNIVGQKVSSFTVISSCLAWVFLIIPMHIVNFRKLYQSLKFVK